MLLKSAARNPMILFRVTFDLSFIVNNPSLNKFKTTSLWARAGSGYHSGVENVSDI